MPIRSGRTFSIEIFAPLDPSLKDTF